MKCLVKSSGIDCNNYSKTLIGWANNVNTPNNVSFFQQDGRTYGPQGQVARNALIAKGWVIDGDTYNPDCILVNDPTVQPSGSNPVTGNIITKVFLSGSQQPTFVRRYYEITPENNANTATGRVTLSFSNQDFKDFNTQTPAPTLLLPDADDAAIMAVRKPNLLIEKRSGTSSDGSGLPTTYTGSVLTFNPTDEDIVWNEGNKNWHVSFDVSGFSGFWVKTQQTPLPVTFGDISAIIKGNQLLINFNTLSEKNNSHFDIEISTDGKTFHKTATLQSQHADGTSNSTTNYKTMIQKGSTLYFSLPAVFVLMAVLLGFQKNRNMKLTCILAITCIGICAVSCNKYNEALQYHKNEKIFVRIAQVDIDGTIQYSPIIKAVTE